MSPKRPILEDDNDSAHKDEEAPKIIHFLNSTKQHAFMVDKILKQEQGLTFDIFKEEEQAPADDIPVDENEEDPENPKPVKAVEE